MMTLDSVWECWINNFLRWKIINYMTVWQLYVTLKMRISYSECDCWFKNDYPKFENMKLNIRP